MSLKLYQDRGICADSSPQTNPEEKPQFEHKGYKDITVIKLRGLYGGEEEVGLTSEYIPPAPKKQERALRKFERYSFIIRRIFKRTGHGDSFVRTELCIQSPDLCKFLRDMIIDTHNSFDISSTPIVMPAPFWELFYCRERLEICAKSKSHSHPKIQGEINLLYDFVRKDKLTIDNLATYTSMVSQGKIDVDTLWTLFAPNKRIFLNTGQASECWLCRDVLRSQKDPRVWFVTGCRLSFNGQELGLATQTYPISFARRVDGSVNIIDLPLIPEDHFDRAETAKLEIKKRGKIFQDIMRNDLSGFAYRHYEGTVWETDEADALAMGTWNERVVIDYQQFLESVPEAASPLERFDKTSRKSSSDSDSDSSSDSEPDDARADIKLSVGNDKRNAFEALLKIIPKGRGIRTLDDLLLFSSPRMPAYGLKSKKWRWVLIDGLLPVKENDIPFKSLQVDSGMKSLIRSLVKGHQKWGKRKDFDDVVENKGKGLVMMLHGEPGIGKTLTAESIAELTASPLYSVSGGELSVDVKTVEKTVTSVFERGNRWKAIILLDEADVVMSKRTSAELERSAIVAVWLRKLEYFEGVLFLTTNRKEQFDDAFQSRIHLTIRLPDLRPRERQAIWKSLVVFNERFIDKARWGDEIYEVLGKLHINGRLIKNLLRTATYHARSDDEHGPGLLAPRHLCDVLLVEYSDDPKVQDILIELKRLVEQPQIHD
ncbi:hypothetical protein ACHAQC_006690 [Fusarium culmorum]